MNCIGKLKGVKVTLDIDETVKPVAQKHRKVPFYLRDKVEAELSRLEEAGIIETVESATNWIILHAFRSKCMEKHVV